MEGFTHTYVHTYIHIQKPPSGKGDFFPKERL